MLGFVQRIEATFDGQAREPNGVGGIRAPAERAGHVDVDVARAPWGLIAFTTLVSRSCRSATEAVATYGIWWAMAMSGTFFPVPASEPGTAPIAGVVAVRAKAGVALERCTPVFMYASLS